MLFDPLPETQRIDVGPDFLDVGQALILCAAFTPSFQPKALALLAGQREYFPMVLHDFVDRRIFSLVEHGSAFLR